MAERNSHRRVETADKARAAHMLLFLLARTCFGAFVLMTSVYCLLVYIPFTYRGVIKWNLVPGLALFVKFHTALYWMMLAVVAVTLARDLRRAETKRLATGFIIFHVTAGVVLSFRPLLPGLESDITSFTWALASLLPLLWVFAIDYAGHGKDEAWPKGDDEFRLSLSGVVTSATFLCLLYGGICYLRFTAKGVVGFSANEMFVALSWSICSHLLVFAFLFIALDVIRRLSSRLSSPIKTEFLLCSVLAAIIAALFLKKVILSALSFDGKLGDLFSVAASVSILAFLGGLSLRLRHIQAKGAASGLELTLTPLLALMPGKNAPRLAKVFWLAALAFFAYVVPVNLAAMDWVFVGQKLSVVFVWAATVAFFCVKTPRAEVKHYPILYVLLASVLGVGAFRVVDLSRYHLPGLLGDERLDVNSALDRYADYEVSFKVATDVLHPGMNFFPASRAETLETDAGEIDPDAFYTFLQQNTDIPESVRVAPVEVNLVNKLSRTGGKKPNVFIFVVDSLRRDYVSSYNKAVTFTPSIESFASESVVMENAFTRYAGTALSEPSIWVGGMLLHRQYAQPFYPMNSLQKLIDVEDYESLITMDPILSLIVRPSPSVYELDKGRDWVDYDLCRTLEEIRTRMDARQENAKPLFVYTQPQNLHIVMRNHRMRTTRSDEHPGFDAFYSTQLGRIDACFGRFVEYLKARDLYDDSIVILTSDHGDDLGEGGRWGHGYWLYPELIRIPFIIHLPQRIRQGLLWNTKDVAFPTDITPSLYYLLGHRPVIRNELFGRPLFTLTRAEQSDYLQDSYLLGSSYGANYGLLTQNGQKLFIAESKNQKDYLFDFSNEPGGKPCPMTAAYQSEQRGLIREHIQAISRFYKLKDDR